MPPRGSRGAILSVALALAGCGEAGDEDRSLDGGFPLQNAYNSEEDKELASQPCWRRERGRWHYSSGHCEAMLPAREMQGVWVTAFEESSFFPGATSIPDPNDPTRYATEIELDRDRIAQRIGREPANAHGDAIWLRFVGRRMRDPYMVDCQGTPYRVFVVDRLLDARYLGAMAPAELPTPEMVRSRPVTVSVRHSGRWGAEEAEAVEHCSGRGRSADRIEDAVAPDQTPSQASPAGNSSAE